MNTKKQAVLHVVKVLGLGIVVSAIVGTAVASLEKETLLMATAIVGLTALIYMLYSTKLDELESEIKLAESEARIDAIKAQKQV
jgi:uncharacterized membrane protein YfcA